MVNEIDAALMTVLAGHGIAPPLSYQVADQLGDGTLVRLLPDYETEPPPVQFGGSERTPHGAAGARMH